jgi:hypothetical protein
VKIECSAAKLRVPHPSRFLRRVGCHGPRLQIAHWERRSARQSCEGRLSTGCEFSAVPSGLLDGKFLTQDCVLGYFQPSLRDLVQSSRAGANVSARELQNLGRPRGAPQIPPLRSPGFPVDLGGVGALHAPFPYRKAHTPPCPEQRGRKSGYAPVGMTILFGDAKYSFQDELSSRPERSVSTVFVCPHPGQATGFAVTNS